MISCMTGLLASVMLCQAPAADAGAMKLLEAIPAEADVVFRVSGTEGAAREVMALVEAVSPEQGQAMARRIEDGLAKLRERFGDAALAAPMLIAMPLPEAGQQPPFGVLLPKADFAAVIKAIAGKDEAELTEHDGGYISLQTPEAKRIYLMEGDGFVGASEHEQLIQAAKAVTPATSVADGLSEATARRLFEGDAAIYVDLTAARARYREPLAAARDQFLGAIEKAGEQADSGEMMGRVSEMYAKMFKGMAQIRVAVVSLDASGKGLKVSTQIEAEPGSKAAEFLARAEGSTTRGLGRLPANMGYYVFADISASWMEAMQRFGMSVWTGMPGAQNEAMEKALADQREVGRIRTLSGMSVDEKGMTQFNMVLFDNALFDNAESAQAYLDSSLAVMKAMEGGGDVSLGFMKDVTTTPAAEEFEGMSLTRVEAKIDPEKMAQLSGGQPGSNALAAMYKDGTVTTWFGVRNQRMVSIVAPDWETAKGYLESAREEERSAGAQVGFREVMEQLPGEASLAMVMSAEGMLNQVKLGMAAQKLPIPEAQPAAGDPAWMGFSLGTEGEALLIDAVIPAAFARSIHDQMIPIIQGMKPKN